MRPARVAELTPPDATATLSAMRRAISTWLEPGRLRPNDFGLPEAVGGLVAGFVLAQVLDVVFAQLSGHPRHPSTYGSDVASFIGLWTGLAGSALVASRRERAGRRERGTLANLATDYGLRFRLVDLPLGIAVGLLSQYVLVFVFELPLYPFVRHLYSRLSQPALSLTGGAQGFGLVVLAVLVCLGSPLVEELFFRGILLRGIAGRLAPLGRRLSAVCTVLLVGALFGLAHFEALELPALAGFGMVLCVLAWYTGRLGPGIVAHVTFNTAAFIAVVRTH